MTPRHSIKALAQKFDQATPRERLLLIGSLLAVLLVLWDALLMRQVYAKQQAQSAEVAALSDSIATAGNSMEAALLNDPERVALREIKTTQAALTQVEASLSAIAAGLVAPVHITALLQEVLQQHPRLTLMSLRSLPPIKLAPPMMTQTTADAAATNDDAQVNAAETAATPPAAAPYLHPVALVVQGSYLDIVTWLHTLEHLSWRFYWRGLALDSRHYPLTEVRLELATLNVDQRWLEFGDPVAQPAMAQSAIAKEPRHE